ncbi:hypothetical protein PV325_007825 [Microctonus aethiopoides]|nr:hypothetical protein PV325_007825 [Microctonus aethiopoides]
MSQKYIKINHEWYFDYNRNEYGGFDHPSEIKVYSNFFETNSIPDVKFEIFCCIPSNEICHVFLSKTPHTPVSATIVIKSIHTQQSERKDVDCWSDSCTLKINFGNAIENILYDGDSSDDDFHPSPRIRFQCSIIWRTIENSEPLVLGNSCERFKNFLTSPDLSDMTIVINEKRIPVHKIILAACSPVFLAMFKADMTESLNKQVIITDIEVDIMEKVIKFMYTGVIDPIPTFNDLLSILEVADKYEIKILKELCEKNLSENRTIDNVLKILERASLYGVPQLIETLISFMVETKSQIVALEDFADLYRRKPELLFEFVIRIANK